MAHEAKGGTAINGWNDSSNTGRDGTDDLRRAFVTNVPVRARSDVTISGLYAYVLVPQFRVPGDEILHDPKAVRVIPDFEDDTAGAEVIFGTSKRPIFTDDNARDFVEQGRPAAHIAGRKCRVENGSLVILGLQASRVLEAIHLGMEYRTAPLDPAIMPAAHDGPVNYEDRADGDAALGRTPARLLDGRHQIRVFFHMSLGRVNGRVDARHWARAATSIIA